MSGNLDANDLALLRSWASEEGIRPQLDPELRTEQLLSIREVFARSLRGIDSELHTHVQIWKPIGDKDRPLTA